MNRVRPASILILLLLSIAVFDIASGLEHWPFGSYPMYSLKYPQKLDWLRLYGVTSAGEVPLRGDGNFAPFDEVRLVSVLSRVHASDLPTALRDLLRLHNRNHDPQLYALRLYSVSWSLHPGLTGNEPPDQKRLLGEVSGIDH